MYNSRGYSMESHLSYANGILIFCRPIEKSLNILKRVLGAFNDFLGLEINATKSFIVF